MNDCALRKQFRAGPSESLLISVDNVSTASVWRSAQHVQLLP